MEADIGDSVSDFDNFVKKEVLSEIASSLIYKTSVGNLFDPTRFGGWKWADETKTYICEFLEQGATPKQVAEVIGNTPDCEKISQSILAVWMREYLTLEDIFKTRKDLVTKWYQTLVSPAGIEQPLDGVMPLKQVTIDDYLDTYNLDTNCSNIHNVVLSSKALYDNNYVFPYTPTNDDAYIMGYLFGAGGIHRLDSQSDFLMRIGKSKSALPGLKKLENLKAKGALKGLKNPGAKDASREVIYKSAIGRLFYLFGVPHGSKKKQATPIPEWIYASEEYRKNFLAGFIDSRMKFYPPKHEIKFHISKQKGLKNELNDYLNNLTALLTLENIETTPRSGQITLEDSTFGKYEHGLLILRCTSDNVPRILALPLKNESLKKQLNQYVGRS